MKFIFVFALLCSLAIAMPSVKGPVQKQKVFEMLDFMSTLVRNPNKIIPAEFLKDMVGDINGWYFDLLASGLTQQEAENIVAGYIVFVASAPEYIGNALTSVLAHAFDSLLQLILGIGVPDSLLPAWPSQGMTSVNIRELEKMMPQSMSRPVFYNILKTVQNLN